LFSWGIKKEDVQQEDGGQDLEDDSGDLILSEEEIETIR
jgi:hypothetical protein